MTFFFHGHERLRFFFDTPNQLGIFLNLIIFLLLGLLFLSYQQKKDTLCLAILTLSVVFSTVLLIMTYSRGAMVGLFAGMALFCFASRKKSLLMVPGLIAIILLLIPGAFTRFLHIFNFSDMAVVNRLILWQGGSAIGARYWLAGAPVPAGGLFSAWYQPINMNTAYSSFVNDYLTIGAVYGLIALAVYLCVLIFCAISTYEIYRKTSNIFALCCCCAITSYAIAASFSTFYNNAVLKYSMLMVVLLIIIIVIYYHKFLSLKKGIFIAVLSAAIITFSLYCIGAYYILTYPVTYEYIKMDNEEYWIASPRSHEAKQIIVCLISEQERDWIYDAKTLLRPLAKHNSIVIAGYYNKRPEIIFDRMNKLAKDIVRADCSVVLLIQGEFDARRVLSAIDVGAISCIVVVDNSFDKEVLSSYSTPTLIISSNSDDDAFMDNISLPPHVFIQSTSYSKYDKTFLVEQIYLFYSDYAQKIFNL